METCPLFSRTPPPPPPFTSSSFASSRNKLTLRFLMTQPTTISNPQTTFSAALRSPRGFGPQSPKKKKKKNKQQQQQLKNETKKNIPTKNYSEEDADDDDEVEEEEEEDEAEAGVIPEIVTNRMMSRMGFSVGIPLFTGLMFFPFFYYLKVGVKVDVPTWVPFIFSFFFFGSALLGVTYGIVSTSWDPMREGSLLGWNEARKNWPVFLQSIRGRSTLKK